MSRALASTYRIMQIKDVCETTSGGTPLRDKREYYDNGTIRWVKSGELKDGPIYETTEKITETGLKESNAKIFAAGTLLIALYGATVGKLGVLKVDAATNQAVCAIFTSHQIDRDYLFYYLLKQRDHLIDSRTGGAQPNISQDTVRNLSIPLPPLPEQQRIAAILERADRLRRLRRYALELSAGYLQAVFVEMFGDPVTNPKGHKVKPLGELIRGFEAGVNYPPVSDQEEASEWRVLKVSAVTWGEFDPQESKPIRPDIEYTDSVVVRQGDLLMSRANTTELVAAVCMVRQIPPMLLLPDKLWRIRFLKDSKLLPEYTLWVLRQPGMRTIIGNLATGSSGSMKNISQEKAVTLPTPVAPIALQAEFSRIVQKHERLRAQQREALRQAEQLFGALLGRAFRGEL
jgi:type I restriction enzyme, S subunit